ncbi:DUF2997 domain-containing protein [Nocardia sp. FBN12]|uniref:DUF2997 domain-containing protein n=1 Tax=Nocardia sp. FBN12 TaxID=3419766 RepID=UPI003CFBEBE4
MSANPVRITLTVGPDGTVAAVTHDALGQECLPYVHALEDMLDAMTVDSDYTQDWWRSESATVRPQAVEPQPDRLDGHW